MFSRTLSLYFARHFARMVLSLFALVLFILALGSLLEFVNRAIRGNANIGPALAMLAIFRVPSAGEESLPFVVLYGSIGAFVMANRRLEVVIARAAGVSAWQFLLPAVAVGLLVGIVGTTLYNPLAADLLSRSNGMLGLVFSKAQSADAKDPGDQPVWMRQTGGGGTSIIGALRSFDDGLGLGGVSAFVFGADGTFRERVDAATARYSPGEWQLEQATVTASGAAPSLVPSYRLSTDLPPSAIRQSFQQVESVSFWTLPSLADVARGAGVPSDRYDLQFHVLLARPILLLAMVLIAASVSLRFSRSRSLGPMIVTGVAVGFMLYVVMKIARDLGSGGVVPPPLAAWLPAAVAILMGVTVLLHLEDG
jgi:lipopolysaccharide export system permease protein